MKKNTGLNYILFTVLGILIASAVFEGYTLLNPPKPQALNAPGSRVTFTAIDSKTVPILAVNSGDNSGVVGNVSVKIIPGTSKVLADTMPFVETDLQYSINVAADVAKKVVNSPNDTDFIISYDMPADVIGGGSAGAATTIATIAALEHKTINKGVIMTGTIEEDGFIGQVGGLVEKAQAASDAGYTMMLIPKGQSEVTYYEKDIVERTRPNGLTYYVTRYTPETKNLSDMINTTMNIKEVSTIQDAEKYFFS